MYITGNHPVCTMSCPQEDISTVTRLLPSVIKAMAHVEFDVVCFRSRNTPQRAQMCAYAKHGERIRALFHALPQADREVSSQTKAKDGSCFSFSSCSLNKVTSQPL